MATVQAARAVLELYPAYEKHETTAVLERLLAADSGICGSLVATADGFVVTKVCQQEFSERKLAAITSSLISLAESLAREVSQGRCHNLIIENEEGSIVAMRVNRTRVLTVMAEKRTRLGLLLSAAKTCVEQLGCLAESAN